VTRLRAALRALLRPREAERVRREADALRAYLAASRDACDELAASEGDLRLAVRDLRAEVELRDHALWAVAVLLARPGVAVPGPGGMSPDAVVELAAHASRARAPS
jgi:hypothetical protein